LYSGGSQVREAQGRVDAKFANWKAESEARKEQGHIDGANQAIRDHNKNQNQESFDLYEKYERRQKGGPTNASNDGLVINNQEKLPCLNLFDNSQ